MARDKECPINSREVLAAYRDENNYIARFEHEMTELVKIDLEYSKDFLMKAKKAALNRVIKYIANDKTKPFEIGRMWEILRTELGMVSYIGQNANLNIDATDLGKTREELEADIVKLLTGEPKPTLEEVDADVENGVQE